MREVWLRPNRRALAVGMLPPIGGALVLSAAIIRYGGGSLLPAAGWCGIALSAVAAIALSLALATPRLAYEPGFLVVYLGAFPERVPIQHVECFFRGQSASLMDSRSSRDPETATVVVRIAQRAEKWHRRNVRPSLGSWCEGYITIRGTWCEPLGVELFRRLNARLVEVQHSSSGTERA